MATIKQIDGRSVHQIQSGQVVVDLCSVVKELIENSIDAGANTIDVRFKNQGLDLIEVQDNGTGISPTNYAAVAMKHCTSKLSTYSDIGSLSTFGFRGEALSSLCALSNMTITTCLEDQVPKGAKLTFSKSGVLQGTSVVAAQKGTIVSIVDLFRNLPVRRRELERNIKREWNKVIALLNQYACIQTNLKFTVSQQPTKGKRIVLFSTKGNYTTRENIINIFGAKTMTALLPLDLEFEMQPTTLGLAMQSTVATHKISKTVQIVGHVSRPVHGEGRQTPDRQMFFVNARPCGLPQFAKTFNEVYRAYNSTQSPFILADIRLDTHLYDVNVSPDKRSILLHDQNHLLDAMRVSLISLFDTHDYTIPTAQLVKPAHSAPGVCSRQLRETLRHAAVEPIAARDDDDASTGSIQSEKSQIPEVFGRNESLPQKKIATLNLLDRWGQKARDISPVPPDTAEGPVDEVSNEEAVEEEDEEEDEEEEDEEEEDDEEESLYDATQLPRELNKVASDSEPTNQEERTPRGELPEAFDTRTANATNLPEASTPSAHPGASQVSSASLPAIRAVTPRKRRADDFGGSLPVRRSPAHRSRAHKISVTIGEQERRHSLSLIEEDGELCLPAGDELLNSTRFSQFAASSGNSTKSQVACSDSSRKPSVNIGRKHDGNQEPSLFVQREEDVVDPDEYPDPTARNKTPAAESEADYEKSVKDVTSKTPVPSLQVSVRRKDATLRLVQGIGVDEDRIERSMASWLRYRVPHRSEDLFEGGVEDITAPNAETKLALIISKSDFGRMRIAGQFNLGFIIAVRPAKHQKNDDTENDELFIIDQHASDEKYNFERLQDSTVLQSQRLVHPKQLELTALEEEIVLQNMESVEANGFTIQINMDGEQPVGSRCQLTALPLSRETTFDITDLEELISLLGEEGTESSHVPRPSKVRKMFAMRACRSSIMIGKALTRSQMATLVGHMGELNKPWNCPHGRPTMRHLCSLQTWDGESWRKDGETGALKTWASYMSEG